MSSSRLKPDQNRICRDIETLSSFRDPDWEGWTRRSFTTRYREGREHPRRGQRHHRYPAFYGESEGERGSCRHYPDDSKTRCPCRSSRDDSCSGRNKLMPPGSRLQCGHYRQDDCFPQNSKCHSQLRGAECRDSHPGRPAAGSAFLQLHLSMPRYRGKKESAPGACDPIPYGSGLRRPKHSESDKKGLCTSHRSLPGNR